MAWFRAVPENLSLFLKSLGGVRSVSDVDGLRVTLDDGRIIHLRPSGNAPEMRCYVEAQDEEAAEDLLRQGLMLIRAG
jgi:phosphomannomutase